MKLNMENFSKASYDVFSMFSDRWALVTSGNMEDFNTMTIAWGGLGSVWSSPGSTKQIVEVFVRENHRTADYILENEYFTVSFFPPEYRKDLGILGSVSGHDNPDKLDLTKLTPKPMGVSVGFEQAELSFLCKKIFCHLIDSEALPEDILKVNYSYDEHMHYIFFGEICGIEGEI